MLDGKCRRARRQSPDEWPQGHAHQPLDHIPAITPETLGNIILAPGMNMAVNGNVIVVPKHN